MVVRISDKTQNYSKVTKLLVKPSFLHFHKFEQFPFQVFPFLFLHLHLNTFTYETDYLCSFPLYVALWRTEIAGAKHSATL